MPVHPDYRARFLEALNDDLNMPRALAVLQRTLKSDLPVAVKHATVLDFDRVLGLGLDTLSKSEELPEEVQKLVEARAKARKAKDFATSDALRDEIHALGYEVQDTPQGVKVIRGR